MRSCCEHLGDEERLRVYDEEIERGKQLLTASQNYSELQRDYPNSYLDITAVLLKLNIPVYEVPNEQNRPRFRQINKISVRDLEKLRVQEARRQNPTGHDQSEGSTSCDTVSMPISSTVSEQEEDNEDGEKDNENGDSQGSNENNVENNVINKPAAVERIIKKSRGTKKGKGTKSLVAPKVSGMNMNDTGIEETAHAEDTAIVQPLCAGEIITVIVEEGDNTNQELPADNEPSTEFNTEQYRRLSTESVMSTDSEIVQPKKRKRTCVISDDDELRDPKGRSSSEVKSSGKQTETGKTERFRAFWERNNSYVSAEEVEILEENTYIKKLKNKMGGLSEEGSSTSNYLPNNIGNSRRIMKYLSPENNLGNFSWSCLADGDKLHELFIMLRDDAKMASHTIANYSKALTLLFETALTDADFGVTYPEMRTQIASVQMSFKSRVSKSTSKARGKEHIERQLTRAYTDLGVYENRYMNIFRNVKAVRDIAVPIIMKAKDGPVNLNESDLFIVNGYFNLFSTQSIGNRPGFFQNMRLDVFEMADKCRQVREDGTAYYFLATAEHKTGAGDLAYIYVDESDWELFRIYRNNIRKPPVDTDRKTLFLNSAGKRIPNPSNDIKKLLERHGVEVMTCNDARHTIETISKHYCSKQEQDVIHRMLTHSPETAKRHYMDANTGSVPHRRGIPLLETLQRKISEKHNVHIDSFLRGSLVLCDQESSVDVLPSTSGATAVPVPRSVSPVLSTASSHSSEESTVEDSTTDMGLRDVKERMDILINRRFQTIGPDVPLPGNKEYETAVADNPDLRLEVGPEFAKRFRAKCQYKQMLARADECAQYYKRTKISNHEEAVRNFLERKQWIKTWNPKDKLEKMCMKKLVKSKMEEATVKRFNSTENQSLLKQVNSQYWPLVKISKCNEGLGAFANQDIQEGTLLCDYHGTLLSDEEGTRRYEAYGDNEANVYMYQFQYGTPVQTKWIDAVVQCSCHKDKQLKGRLLNHTNRNANAIPRVKIIDEKAHIFLYASKDIKKHTQLKFNYGVHKDRHSSKQDWMKE